MEARTRMVAGHIMSSSLILDRFWKQRQTITDGLDIRCGKKRQVKNDSKVLAYTNGRMELPLTETYNAMGETDLGKAAKKIKILVYDRMA